MGCNAPQESRIVPNPRKTGMRKFFPMQALNHWPLKARRRITGVLTDIDDTLTNAGAVTPDALAALGALKAGGVHVIAVTGRPSGWSEPFALEWPVDAIVAENGAVAFLPHKKAFYAYPAGVSCYQKCNNRMGRPAPATFAACKACWSRSSANCRGYTAPPIRRDGKPTSRLITASLRI